ncbi:MAG: GbsR/MarR family transcriptional regulator [Ktedonobacterales bacterium]
MPPPEHLSPEVHEFIDSMGIWFEKYSLPRIGGRILGLMIVTDSELSFDDIAGMLLVSRASVSTNIRLVMAIGLAELVTHPGDRHDYYRFAHNAWERALLVDIEGTLAFRRLGERGLDAVRDSEAMATEHLQSLIEYCDVVLEDRQTILSRWRERHPAK